MIRIEYNQAEQVYLVYQGREQKPWLKLPLDLAQALVDDLIELGVMPPKLNSYQEGRLDAITRHLEDMRSLALMTPDKDAA